MTHQSQIDSLVDFADATELFSRGCGLSLTAAKLFLLQSVGAVAARSIEATSPEMTKCTPGFDLIAIHEGYALLPGSLIAALDGVKLEMEDSIAAQQSLDRRDLILKKAVLQDRSAKLTEEIEKNEKWTKGRKVESSAARVIRQYSLGPGELPSSTAVESRDPFEERAAVQREFVDLLLMLNPGVIRTDGDWQQFPEAGRFSFDGGFFQIANASSLLGELGSRSNRLRQCGAVVRRSRSETTFGSFEAVNNRTWACCNVSGSPEEIATLLRSARIKTSGLLESALLCECDGDEPPDANALLEFHDHEWHDFTRALFRLRAAGACDVKPLDESGVATYFQFREWCRELMQRLPAEQRISFLRWPELMIRMAISLALIEGSAEHDFLETRFLEEAGALLKVHAEEQLDILSRLATRANSPNPLDGKIAKMVQRLELKGPQTKRDLARSIHGQNYGVIDFILGEATRRGVIVLKENRYQAAPVSVNASTQPLAPENEGEVAA